ncbi:MAG TPA: ribosome small subunit-dependent GTPase A [Symbiobacteriaceae bacterium]
MSDTGIVIRNDGPRFWVDLGHETLGNQEIPCGLRGKLKREHQRVTSIVVVGDRVQVERTPDGGGMIDAVEPRKSELSRPGFHGYVHVMAANVDQLIIVGAAQQPRFKLHLVERFMRIANRGHMAVVVVINKCDLEHEATIRSWVVPLLGTGVPVILTSTLDGRGVEELRALLQGRISVLAGQSGVGKSSLVNWLYPEAMVRTNAVSDASNKGRHTTTSSRLYGLPGGGYLVDTPGIKELTLFEDDEEEESAIDIYPEITTAAAGCKFRDCTHSHEPNCAVKAAVARGDIRPERYHNFLRMGESR